MAKGRLARFDSVMRLLHLYTGLFLIPWLLVYATSAFCLNHAPWINKTFNIGAPTWKTISQVEFVPDNTFPKDLNAQAQVIMQNLNLDGIHRVLPKSTQNNMTIMRPSGGGNYRITWQRQKSQLTVERQPFSSYRLLHFLHFRGGYRQKYFAQMAWAAIVDLVAVSIWLWVLSGLYIWFRRRRDRVSGNICLAACARIFAGAF